MAWAFVNPRDGNPLIILKGRYSVDIPITLRTGFIFVSDYMEMDQFPMKSSKSEKFDETDDVTNERILSRKKRQAPYIIYPEILCIIDYDGYR